MNKFTKDLIDKAMIVTTRVFGNLDVNITHLTIEQKKVLAPPGKWVLESFGIDANSKSGAEDFEYILTWMDQFIRDGVKVITISTPLAMALIEADLPEDVKWDVETFGCAGLLEIGSHNYIFTSAEGDKDNKLMETMLVNEFTKNGKFLFKNDEPIKLIKRVSYIFRNRPNGIIIQKQKPKPADVKKNARKLGKKVEEMPVGTIYVIKEDAFLQTKYVKQLQEKDKQKHKNNEEEGFKRQFRSWRRGHFRKQPVGPRVDRLYELRWVTGHWMGSMGLPIRVQAAKIRHVDVPPQQPRYSFLSTDAKPTKDVLVLPLDIWS